MDTPGESYRGLFVLNIHGSHALGDCFVFGPLLLHYCS